MNRIYTIFVLLVFSFLTSIAQEKPNEIPQDLLDAIFSQIVENNEQEDIDQTQLYEDLFYLSQYPINLNATNKKELEQLQFLSDIQIENLLFYLYQYRGMYTIYELQLVEGLFDQDIRNMLPFVTVGAVKKETPPLRLKDVFKYGKHEILARSDKGVETKEGYRFFPEEELEKYPNKRYEGDPFYYSLKYRFRYSNRVQFGFTGEKDAGEQAWSSYNKVFDFYSGHLQMNDIWKFKTINLGDFSASFGQGLVLNTNYGLGKSAMALNVMNRNEGLKKYSSTDEYNFFRGAGATVKFDKLNLTAFYSIKKIDGDTANGVFASIKKDGLHRTPSNIDKKHNVWMQVVGANASYRQQFFRLGATFLNVQLDHTLTPNPANYNYYYFSGKKQTLGSIDYKARWRKILFFGEMAFSDQQNGVATLNGITMTPISQVGVALLHRYYSKEYYSLFSNAFGETSSNNNEEGLYMAVEVNPFSNWKFMAFADAYRFSWYKFGIDAPSDGYEYLFRADFMPNRDVNMYWRFRFEQKEKNISALNNTTTYIGDLKKGSVRYLLKYELAKNLKLQNIVEGSYAKTEDSAATRGLLLAQDLSYSFMKIPVSVYVRYEFFDIESYDNRIYSYERDVLYAFSIPAMNGRGSRCYLNLKYSATDQISIYSKIAQTVYMDKESIGSSQEEISGNKKTDIRILLRMKF